MNKHMRELQAQIAEKAALANGYIEGESKDLDKAEALLKEIDQLQKEFELAERLEKAGKDQVPDDVSTKKKVDGFSVIAKMMTKKPLSEVEKSALISGTDATQGENYLVPEDVRAAINELRRSYVSARELVTVITTTALSGSINYEAGTPAGLTAFDDGDDITEETGISFVKKAFTIGWMGKLIPISRILLGAEQADLMSYLDRWFVRNATISENKDIFAALKAGYNSGTPKDIAGWKALKKSITVDLDPSCLIDGVIVTNQSGFACLDEEEDADGRPVLQPNPANPTQKLFQGLPIKVYPDAQLANLSGSAFPMIYGSTKAGCTFVENGGLQFSMSEHYAFNKNQNVLRVIEGYDVMSTDTSAYIYGSFAATAGA